MTWIFLGKYFPTDASKEQTPRPNKEQIQVINLLPTRSQGLSTPSPSWEQGWQTEATSHTLCGERCWCEPGWIKACLDGGGGLQVGEVTRSGGVKNNPPLHAILQPRDPGVHFLKINEWSLST